MSLSGDIFGSDWKESFKICTYSKKGQPTTTTDVKDKEDVEEYLEKYLDMEILSVTIYASEVPYDLDQLDKIEGPVGTIGKSMAFSYTGQTKIGDAFKCGSKFKSSQRKSEPDKAHVRPTYAYDFREYYKLQEEANIASIIHHDFVLMEVKGEKRYFLTIEKMSDAIIIQAAESEDMVRHCILSSTPNRNLFQNPLESDVCKNGIKVQDVVNRMYLQNELKKGYSVIPGGDHCQHFCQRVFEFLAKEKKYPSIHKTKEQIFLSLKEEADRKHAEEQAMSEKESGQAKAQPQ